MVTLMYLIRRSRRLAVIALLSAFTTWVVMRTVRPSLEERHCRGLRVGQELESRLQVLVGVRSGLAAERWGAVAGVLEYFDAEIRSLQREVDDLRSADLNDVETWSALSLEIRELLNAKNIFGLDPERRETWRENRLRELEDQILSLYRAREELPQHSGRQAAEWNSYPASLRWGSPPSRNR